jgi:hypothetical protein
LSVSVRTLRAAPVSLHQSKDGLALSQDRADPAVGKPLFETSVAGVNRRANRRNKR